MRAVFIGLLVLGLSSFVQAGLVFTVNGEPQPDEIWILPSQAVGLGLALPDGSIMCFDITYKLGNELAELITTGYVDDFGTEIGAIEFPIDFDYFFPRQVVSADPMNVRMSTLYSEVVVPGSPDKVLMDNLVLHCLGEGDVVLDIVVSGTTHVDGQDIPIGEVLHTLSIHQVPEPSTLLLLGLGIPILSALRKKRLKF